MKNAHLQKASTTEAPVSRLKTPTPGSEAPARDTFPSRFKPFWAKTAVVILGKVKIALKRKLGGLARALAKKSKRVREWTGVVYREAGVRGVARVAVSLAFGAISWAGRGSVSPRVWKSRLRACAGCPVYDRGRHACRDREGLGLGCGCWMPAKARVSGPQCWRKRLDGGGHPE